MRLLIIFLFLAGGLNAQVYNSIDTTWTLQYNEVLTIRKKIETAKQERKLLETEIEVLIKLNNTKDLIIKKQQVRDSLYSMELEKYKEMDDIMREKVFLSNDIINNYKILLLSTEQTLRATDKKRKSAEFWNKVYKYSYMIGGGVIAGILILK